MTAFYNNFSVKGITSDQPGQFFCKLFIIVISLAITLAYPFCLAYAEGSKKDSNKSSKVGQLDLSTKESIKITADHLEFNNKEQYAEFSGNVKAVQGNVIITANIIKVFLQDINKQDKSTSTDRIKEIQAKGNVEIKIDNKVAVTEFAVYKPRYKILILNGPQSKIISDKDFISGNKITFYQESGKIKVESGKQNRVEAIIHSNGDGLNYKSASE